MMLKYAEETKTWSSSISRKRTLEPIYRLFSQLYSEDDWFLGIGMGEDEIKFAKKYRLNIVNVEPDVKKAREIREKYKIEVINHPFYNLPKSYLETFRNFFSGIFCHNVIQWIPNHPIGFFENLYTLLKYGGLVSISFYIEIRRNAPDREYLIIGDKILDLIVREMKEYGKGPIKIKLKNKEFKSFTFPYLYSDRNGKLGLYILSKEELEDIRNIIYERVLCSR
jgi:SAM-dependent methyltransferase